MNNETNAHSLNHLIHLKFTSYIANNYFANASYSGMLHKYYFSSFVVYSYIRMVSGFVVVLVKDKAVTNTCSIFLRCDS